MEGDCLCPQQWSDTFGSHNSVKCLAKVSDNMRKTVLNVAQRRPQEASCFKYIFQKGGGEQRSQFLFFTTPKGEMTVKVVRWQTSRLIFNPVKGLAAGLKTENTHRKQRLVNFTAEGTDSSTPLKVFLISVQILAPFTYVWLWSICQTRVESEGKPF